MIRSRILCPRVDATTVASTIETSAPAPASSPRSRSVLVSLLVLVATIAGLCCSAGAAQARVVSSAPPAGYLVRHVLADTFNRTVTSGWGAAPVGGRYQSLGATGHAMALRGNAYFTNVPSGHARVQRSLAVMTANLYSSTTLNLPRIPRSGTWGTYVGLEMRVQRNGSAYSATVHVSTGGRATLLIDRRSSTGTSVQLAARSLPTMHAGRTYHLQAAIVGGRIWARMFAVGTRAPLWLAAKDYSRWAVRGAGQAGIILATAGRHTTSSATFGSLSIYSPARRIVKRPRPVESRPVASTPAPSASAPSTPAPSTPAPSAPSTPAPSAPSTPAPSTPAPSAPSAPSTPAPSAPSTPAPSAPSTPAPSAPSTPAPSAPSTPAPSAPSTPAPSTPSTPAPSTPSTPAPNHVAQVIANAGAAPLGTTSYAVPAGAIFVSPSGSDSSGNGSIGAPFATLPRALQAATNGSTVVLRGGVYHESVYIRANLQVTVESYPGETVWFDGSVPVTAWTQSGNDWVLNGWMAQFDHSASFSTGSNAGGFVNSAYPMAAWPDQVFFDGVQLQQVAANPSAGEFAVNYATQQLIVGSDPSGHAVRASDLSQAFIVAGRATLRGFGIRNYATALPQMGTLFVGGLGGNTIQNVVVDNNAGQGIATASPNNVIDHVSLTANGMTGLSSAYSDGEIVENSLISGNNTQHFNSQPSAGGIKVGRLDGITIRDNFVQNNINITGIWTDENVTNFSITGNVVQNNGAAYGIENELSGTGIVANNLVSGSKYGYTAFDSGNIEVYNNDVTNNSIWDIGLTQDNRWQPGMGTAGPRVQPSPANPWLVQNIVVANNNFGRSNGMFQFYVLDKQTNRSANSMNLQVVGNQFAPRTNSAQPWAIGWGMGDNVTVHCYATSAAFNSGEGKSWLNTMAGAGTGLADPAAATPAAQPLPSDVAAAIGQSVGTMQVGTF